MTPRKAGAEGLQGAGLSFGPAFERVSCGDDHSACGVRGVRSGSTTKPLATTAKPLQTAGNRSQPLAAVTALHPAVGRPLTAPTLPRLAAPT